MTGSPTAFPTVATRLERALSRELATHRGYGICQACGAVCTEIADRSGLEEPVRELTRWIECDEWDRPGTGAQPVVGLCRRCADRVIEPHPRLYHPLGAFEPAPGAMAICVGCRWQDTSAGMRCGAPAARFHGGPGLTYEQAAPVRMHICARGRGARSGWLALYPEPVRACSGREPVTEDGTVPSVSQFSAERSSDGLLP